MSGYPGGVWSGAQDAPHTAGIMGPAPDDGKGGGPLRARLPGTPLGNSGALPVTHNI